MPRGEKTILTSWNRGKKFPMTESRREAIIKGMSKPEVKARLSILNQRKRSPMKSEHKAKISNKLVGKDPKNLLAAFFSSNKYHAKHGWLEIGNKRYFMRSIWERNYARYLQWLKERGEILEWEYEPKVFLFEKIQFGNRTYKPDFGVIEKNGKCIWHEVKGWMNPDSRVKLKRMAKYFPDEKIILIDEGAYRSLKNDVKNMIPDWESDNVYRIRRLVSQTIR